MVSSLLTYYKCQMARIQNLHVEQFVHIWSMSKSQRIQNPFIMYSYTHACNLWEDELQMPQIIFINKQQ
jgi:hypothetical protein